MPLRLTPNQREVLDLLKTETTLYQMTVKLGIHRSTLNHRIKTLRYRLNLPKEFKRRHFKDSDIELVLQDIQDLNDELQSNIRTLQDNYNIAIKNIIAIY